MPKKITLNVSVITKATPVTLHVHVKEQGTYCWRHTCAALRPVRPCGRPSVGTVSTTARSLRGAAGGGATTTCPPSRRMSPSSSCADGTQAMCWLFLLQWGPRSGSWLTLQRCTSRMSRHWQPLCAPSHVVTTTKSLTASGASSRGGVYFTKRSGAST